jgi:hypothetical protein
MNPDQTNEPEIHQPPELNVQGDPPIGVAPEVSFGAVPEAAAAPSTPPPAPLASGGWLPPTVPVQSGSAGSDQGQGTASATLVPAPAVADDGDVIEKEWVHRAKQIVERTRQDPHMQTKELHKFKAEYMQKRYNKTIKAVEE